MTTYEENPTVPLTTLSVALDEIYRLRTLLAYEAAIREVDLQLKTYPKSRQVVALDSINRMRVASRGEMGIFATTAACHSARQLAGMPNILTRSTWEEQMLPREVSRARYDEIE